MKTIRKPLILSLSGHDPSGGAGIQADIEATHAHGCHAATVITCLTVQDTHNVYHLEPVSTPLFLRQVEAILDDMPVHAVKIGLIGCLDMVNAIQQVLKKIAGVPVILDPVLAAGGGQSVSKKEIADAIIETLLPYATLITPNIPEALQLCTAFDTSIKRELSDGEGADCAGYFHESGCDYTLITGTHSTQKAVVNTLYQGGTKISATSWPRLPYNYHGSGCTLSSSIAALAGSGVAMPQAVEQAQKYTWESLHKATLQGGGQLIPYR